MPGLRARHPARSRFGNTIKKVSAIRRALRGGRDRCSPSTRSRSWRSWPSTRPAAGCIAASWWRTPGADWPLSRKFGTTVESARDLMIRAGQMGLDPYGLSFHVGSQQMCTSAYEVAIARVGMLFTDLRDAGVNLRMVNLGGGFPVRYRDEVPTVDKFATAIMHAMTEHFGNDLPEILIEPGRSMVGDAGVVHAEVVLVSRRIPDEPTRWVYLDIGRFGGLAETEGESIKYRIETGHDGGATGPVCIAGPTCDGADILYERSNYRLPLALTHGDTVNLMSAGAYVTTYASQRFNGFAPLAEHYV